MLNFSLFHKRRKKIKEIEPHEVFLDDLTQKKEEELGTSKKRLEVPLSFGVFRIFSLCIILLFVLLFGRTFQLQIVKGEHFSNLATRNILSVSRDQLSRGIIYDRNREQLVYNSPRYDLYFRNNSITLDEKYSITQVSKILGKNSSSIIEKIEDNKDSPFTLIKRGLDHDNLVKIEASIDNLQGFFLSETFGRDYKFGTTFSHVTGYMAKIDRETLQNNPGKYSMHDYIGKTGVEEFYEDYLVIEGKKVKSQRDVFGNLISSEEEDSPEEVQNIVLTIDGKLQRIAEGKAKEKVEELGTVKASVVALDPQTGDVLAMVNIPSFDSNVFGKGSLEEISELFNKEGNVFLNRTTSASYATGSVIKPLLALAALEEEIISPEKEIYSKGYITIPNRWNPSEPSIFRDFHAHGWRNMYEAIAVSSNVYFYAIGGGYEDQEGLGVSRIAEYLKLFGWGEKSGIDLPGEKGGFIPTPEWKREDLNSAWYIGDTYNLSIGQGYLSVTPLQIANSYAALVNGGTLFSPKIVKEIIDRDGNVIEKIEGEIIRDNIAKKENLDIVKQGMRETTRIGTATSLRVLPVESGAKTGTSQITKEGVNNNWVTVFAPYDDPEIVITVLMEEVEGVTPVATHLARDILLSYFKEQE